MAVAVVKIVDMVFVVDGGVAAVGHARVRVFPPRGAVFGWFGLAGGRRRREHKERKGRRDDGAASGGVGGRRREFSQRASPFFPGAGDLLAPRTRATMSRAAPARTS